MGFLKFYLQETDEVVDIGSNFGQYVYHLSKIVKNGSVYAFEPILATFKILEKIIKHLKLDNVYLHNLGCSDNEQFVTFIEPLQRFGARDPGLAYMKQGFHEFNEGKYKTSICKIVILDNLLTNLKNLTFIKCDIEGAEFLALKGAEKSINQFRPLILCEISPEHFERFEYTLNEFEQYIRKLNYTFGAVQNSEGSRLKFVPSITSFSGNCFFVPNEKLEQFF